MMSCTSHESMFRSEVDVSTHSAVALSRENDVIARSSTHTPAGSAEFIKRVFEGSRGVLGVFHWDHCGIHHTILLSRRHHGLPSGWRVLHGTELRKGKA